MSLTDLKHKAKIAFLAVAVTLASTADLHANNGGPGQDKDNKAKVENTKTGREKVSTVLDVIDVGSKVVGGVSKQKDTQKTAKDVQIVNTAVKTIFKL